MPINLSKGQKVDLTKGNPGLKEYHGGYLAGMSMHSTQVQTLTLMQQHLCLVPMVNARQTRNLSSMETWNIRQEL